MRWQFQLSLCNLARKDKRVFLIYGDVGATMFAPFAKEFPDRILNIGLMEQSMVSFAAGMAMQGFRPIVYTITPFLLERAFEQIKIDVDQMNLPVGLVGYSEPGHGPTHECLDERIILPCTNIRCYRPTTNAKLVATMQQIDFEKPWFLSLRPDESQ